MLKRIAKMTLWICIVFIYVSMIFMMDGMAEEQKIAPVHEEFNER